MTQNIVSANIFTYTVHIRTNKGVVLINKENINVKAKKSINNTVSIPAKEEPRSKRVNLLLQPSVHKKAQKKCTDIGISLNECMNQLLSSWIGD